VETVEGGVVVGFPGAGDGGCPEGVVGEVWGGRRRGGGAGVTVVVVVVVVLVVAVAFAVVEVGEAG